MRHEEDDRITDDGEEIESEEGGAKSPAIDHDSAGVGVDRAEQSAQRIEGAYDENRRAERLEIFWDETHPQFLSRSNRKDRDEQDDQVAAQPEKFRQRALLFHQLIRSVVAVGRLHHSTLALRIERIINDKLARKNLVIAQAKSTETVRHPAQALTRGMGL